MEKLANCRKYGGYPHENASQFLAEFESYAILHNIQPEEHPRQIAAFHLHLSGPALTWFNKLSSDDKKSWPEFVQLFKSKYIEVDFHSPTVLLESEVFETLKLSKGQSIDDYYSQLLEKATILRKHDHEILVKFIKGLPEQLAFFVRAGNHGDSASALTAAKMGEAYGYRTDDTLLVAAAKPVAKHKTFIGDNEPKSPVVELQGQINLLTQTVAQLANDLKQQKETTANNDRRFSRPRNREPQGTASDRGLCRKCRAPGHFARACNWNEHGNIDCSVQCRICGQTGHNAPQCTKFNSGNRRSPGLAGQEPREEP